MRPERPLWRARLLPLFVGLVVLNLLLFLAWTLPRGHRLRNAAARAEAARAEASQLRGLVAGQRERAAAARANAQDLVRFYDTLVGPEATELLPALQEIERMASLPGLHSGGRAFDREKVEDARVERISVTLPLEGSYRELVAFLREVERSPRFLTVDRIAMRSEEGGAALQVVLSTYVRAPAGAPEGSGRAGGAR